MSLENFYKMIDVMINEVAPVAEKAKLSAKKHRSLKVNEISYYWVHAVAELMKEDGHQCADESEAVERTIVMFLAMRKLFMAQGQGPDKPENTDAFLKALENASVKPQDPRLED